MILGFSTGCFYRWCEPISKEAVLIVRSLGVNAIELMAGYPKRVDSLHLITKEDVADFAYVSLHAPSRMKYTSNEETKRVLSIIENWCKQVKPQTVVFHPDTIDDWDILSEYEIPYAFENMDATKTVGIIPSQMSEILAKDKTFHALLDIQHVYTHDTEMKQTKEFVKCMGDKLGEIHLSAQEDESCAHGALHLTSQDIILHKTKEILSTKPHTPIIIESVLDSKEAMEKELLYVKRFLD